jgi:predicted PurR-regulated permease PerM
VESKELASGGLRHVSDWRQFLASVFRPATAQDAGIPDGTSPAEQLELRVVHVLPSGEVVRVTLVLLGLGLGLYLLWRLQELLFLIFLALLLATTIDPLVRYLRRGPFGRASGVLAIYSMIVVAIGLPIALVAPSLALQVDSFTTELPARVQGLYPIAKNLQPRLIQQAAMSALDQATILVRQSGPPTGDSLVQAGASAAHLILNFFMVFVLAFYWLMERNTLKRGALQAVPRHRAKEVNEVWVELEEKLGAWVRGQLLLMLMIGVMALVTFIFVGLPSPIVLAVLAGLAEMIPILGPYIAFVPAVLIALTVAPEKVLLVIGCAVVIQLIETNVLVPRVMSHTVGISPLTIIIGIQAGAILYGLYGALLAVPIAAAVQVILAHALRAEDPIQAEAHDEADASAA